MQNAERANTLPEAPPPLGGVAGSASLHKLIMNKQTEIFINILHIERASERAFCTNYIFMQFLELRYTAVHANVATAKYQKQLSRGRVRSMELLGAQSTVRLATETKSPQVQHLVAIDKPIAGPQTSCNCPLYTSPTPLRGRRRQMAGRLFVAYLFNTFEKHSTLLLINFSCCLLMQPVLPLPRTFPLTYLPHPGHLQCPLTFDPSRGESSCSESRCGICFIIIVINTNGYSIVAVVIAAAAIVVVAAVIVFSVFHFWSGLFFVHFQLLW